MTFTVTYRGVDGSLREESVEAAGRAECVAALRARGIVAVSIRDGRAPARSGIGKRAASSRVQQIGRVAFVVTVVMIVTAGGVWWWSTRSARDETHPTPTHEHPARVEKPAKGTGSGKGTSSTNAVSTNSVPQEVPVRERVPIVQTGTNVVTSGATTNRVVKMSPEDEAAFERVKRETSLRTQVENRMALLATIKPGMPVPPMPPIPNLEQDFEKAEANVITVTEGDTEQDLMRKEFVIQLKERISAAKKEGKTATEALNEYVEAMREVADFRQKSLLAARQMERDGDAEAAKKLVDEANAQLKEIGAEPIDLHPAPKGKKKKSN